MLLSIRVVVVVVVAAAAAGSFKDDEMRGIQSRERGSSVRVMRVLQAADLDLVRRSDLAIAQPAKTTTSSSTTKNNIGNNIVLDKDHHQYIQAAVVLSFLHPLPL